MVYPPGCRPSLRTFRRVDWRASSIVEATLSGTAASLEPTVYELAALEHARPYLREIDHRRGDLGIRWTADGSNEIRAPSTVGRSRYWRVTS